MNPHVSGQTIGERIKARRHLHGLSIRQAASRAGLSHQTWGRIERRGTDNRFTLAAIAGALRCPVGDLTGQPPQPVDRDQAETGGAVWEAMRAVIETDLGYAPLEQRNVDLHSLGREVDLIADLRAHCDYLGAAQRLPDVLRGLHAAAFGPSRPDALRLIVMVDEFASHIIRYLGHPSSACWVADRAQQAAEALADPVMLGLAAYGRAHGHAGCGLYERTLMLSEAAAANLEGHAELPDALPMRGQLLMTAGFAKYALGDTSGAAVLVAEAQDIAEHTGQTAALRLNFGPTNIRFWEVAMETDGGDPGRAVAIASATNPNFVDSPSRQVAFYLDFARALARIKRDREAIRLLITAERMAPQRVRNNPLVVETARDLLDRASGSELRGLCERVGVLM